MAPHDYRAAGEVAAGLKNGLGKGLCFTYTGTVPDLVLGEPGLYQDLGGAIQAAMFAAGDGVHQLAVRIENLNLQVAENVARPLVGRPPWQR